MTDFFFDTADEQYIRRVWDHLSKEVKSERVLGVTTNPNALSKINCNTLADLETVIPKLCSLVTEIIADADFSFGVVYVQTPNSRMDEQGIWRWAEYVTQLTDGTTNVGLKIPHFSHALMLAPDLADSGVEVNVTGCADWAAIVKTFGFQPHIRYASIITGRMEEAGLDANAHLEAILGLSTLDSPATIAGSMRTLDGVKNAVYRGATPTIGSRVFDQFLALPPADFTMWTNVDDPYEEYDFEDQVTFLPLVTETSRDLSVAFFDQMDALGAPLYEEFKRK